MLIINAFRLGDFFVIFFLVPKIVPKVSIVVRRDLVFLRV